MASAKQLAQINEDGLDLRDFLGGTFIFKRGHLCRGNNPQF